MIYIYSDASVYAGKKATSACIVLQDSKFMGKKAFGDCPVATPLYAEVWGVVKALEYAKEVCGGFEGEDIMVYTDAIAVLDSLQYTHTNSKEQFDMDVTLQSTVRKYNVDVRLTKGHQRIQNPNKFVDFLANQKLRS